MARSDRLRRVVLLCTSFARNLAYYRAGRSQSALPLLDAAHPQASFWRVINGNFLDMCVLEWCKLFAEPRKGEHFWRRIVTDSAAFETQLHAQLGMTAAEFDALIEAMRRYRDKFVAHLDSDHVMHIPTFSAAQASVWLYHQQVVLHEATAGELAGLADTPDKLRLGYTQSIEEAEQAYRAVSLPR
jgi:hypothetical protein